MINKGPLPLSPSTTVQRGGINPVGNPTLPSLPLIKGQVIEGEVIQVKPNLLVETHASIFSAALSGRQFAVGERLLFRVLNPDAVPPKLLLISNAHLPDSPIAQHSPLLRSLLYRHDSLTPVLQWLLQNHSQAKPESTSLSLLRQFWQLPAQPQAEDIRRLLLQSGLFSEGRTKGGTMAQLIGPATSASDLKALLQILVLEENQTHLKPLLEAIASVQIKALDALLSSQLNYQWLIPWGETGYFWANLRQSDSQRQRRQWSLQLHHEGLELGTLNINLLLTEGQVMGGPSLAALHFASDTNWLVALVKDSKPRLQEALEPHNIFLHQVSVGPVAPPLPRDPVVDNVEQTAILDIKV
ncbi:MAG: hypothetical protein QGI54_10365 [Gammaproteobacteria bacterium]|nr:hypothetical protein [Gammaproteobacteria bacterium]